jgi:hypothetical protein
MLVFLFLYTAPSTRTFNAKPINYQIPTGAGPNHVLTQTPNLNDWQQATALLLTMFKQDITALYCFMTHAKYSLILPSSQLSMKIYNVTCTPTAKQSVGKEVHMKTDSW